ncbi:MAG: glycosyltransferase family protein [Steroidobacteraceae bacterium]
MANGSAGFHDASDNIKVLLYSHDTFGLGHLRRNLAIAESLLRYPERFSVLLITGSPVIKQWKLPAGLHVQPLPPVVKTGAERYVSRESGEIFGLVKGYREALILKTVLRYRPDVFLVDHAPAGMNGELLSTLALIRREFPAMRTVLGLRDILDSHEIVKAVWQEQDIHGLLEQAYDDVFVYGSESLVDVARDYGLTGRIASRVHYCGYVVAATEPPGRCSRQQSREVCWNRRHAGERPVILVTAGGGGDGFFLMEAYLRAHAQLATPGFYSVIVTGPLMPEEQKSSLRALAGGRTDVELVDHTTNLVPSLDAAHLIVAMAGYNTSAEIIAARRRAILVPRAAPRAEQRIRAQLLTRLGVVRSVEPGPHLVRDLARLLPAAVAEPPPSESAWAALDLNGARRVVENLLEVMSDVQECAA